MKVQLFLDDRKVRFQFGPRPEMGKALPIFKNVEVGLKWQEFGKKWVKDKVSLPYRITAKFLKPGLWEITLEDSIYELAVNWLMTNCGVGDFMPRIKAGKQRPGKARARTMLVRG